MPEWQLITYDSPGNTGFAVLVAWVDGAVEYAERDSATGQWRSADVMVRAALGSKFYDTQPSHWCPLPWPPSKDDSKVFQYSL
jgi:hypothetical protein